MSLKVDNLGRSKLCSEKLKFQPSLSSGKARQHLALRSRHLEEYSNLIRPHVTSKTLSADLN